MDVRQVLQVFVNKYLLNIVNIHRLSQSYERKMTKNQYRSSWDGNETGLDTYWKKLMTASPSRQPQWLSQGRRERGWPMNAWQRALEKTWTAGFKHSWRKTEAATQDRTGRSRVSWVCAPQV